MLALKRFLLHPHSRKPIGVILLVGIIVRLIHAWVIMDTPLIEDAVSYHGVALKLLSGKDYIPYWPPGLPLMLAAFISMLGDNYMAILSCMMLCYLLFSYLLYNTCTMVVSRATANIAVLLFALYPAYIHHSTVSLTQLPTALCLMAVLWGSLKYMREKGYMYLFIIGLSLGAAVLIRPSSLTVLLMVPPMLWFLCGWKNFAPLWIIGLVASLMIVSWEVKVYQMTDRFIFVNEANSRNIFLGNNPYTPLYKTWWLGSHANDADPRIRAFRPIQKRIDKKAPAEQSKAYFAHASAHMLDRPELFVLRTLNRLRCFWGFDTFSGAILLKGYRKGVVYPYSILLGDAIFYALIMLMGIGGAIFLHKYIPSKLLWLSITMIVTYTAPYCLAFSHPTYHFPIMPLIGVLAAMTFSKLLRIPQPLTVWTHLSPRHRRIMILAMLIFVVIQLEWMYHMLV